MKCIRRVNQKENSQINNCAI